MKLQSSNRNNASEKLRALDSWLAVLALTVCVNFFSVMALAPSAWAQKATGTITGGVTDPSGAVVPGATVTIVNDRTSGSRSATTNEQGSFSFPEVDAGTYTLSVTKSGFKKQTLKNVELHVADVTNLSIKMDMGAATEVVEVQASALILNTSTGEVGNIMTEEQVRELPVNGRNFVQLTTLVPGAAVGESFDNKNKGLFAGVDISFSGSPSVDNQWTVDGAANNDIGSQRTILTYPSIDGIEEFKIQRNSYGPEFGGASGAQINVVTKGGSNQFHGDVYYFGRNDALNAKNYFLLPGSPNSSGGFGACLPGDLSCKKNMLRRNDYGYTLGGPIKKDKVYFFWSEEWNRERRGRVHRHYVPTEQEKMFGDFTDLRGCLSTGTDALGYPIPGGIPVDPATGARFGASGQMGTPGAIPPTDIIPADRLSPAGQAYLAPLPLPNITNLCGQYNWVDQVRIPVDWREEAIRGDWNVTKKTTLMLKFTQDSWINSLHADEAAGLWGDSDFPALSDTWNQPGKMAIAKLTTTIGNTAVNDFQFSWSGNRITVSRAGDTPALNDQINAIMPRLFPFSDKLHGTKAAEPVMWDGNTNSGILGIISPWHNRQDLFVWKDDFSKVSGKHTFKVGFLYSRNAKDEEVGDEGGELWAGGNASGPAVDYKGPGWTSPNFCGGGWGTNCNIGTNNYYGDYLLRGMTFGYDETQLDHQALVRWRDYESYAGDTFKVSRRVTLNYGARWSLIRTPYLDDNKLAGFSPAVYFAETSAPSADPCRGIVLAKGATNTCSAIGSSVTPPFFENRSLVHDNNHMIMPRAGIAWDVFGTGRFAIRAGVGQFESRDRLLAISMRANNPPFGVGTGAQMTLDGPSSGSRASFAGNDPGNEDACLTTGCVFGAALGGSPHQGLDPSSKQSNSWQWNLTTETAFWRNSKLEVGWVANRGIHLQNVYDANQIPLANRLEAAQLAVTGTSPAFLKPFPYNQSAQMPIWSHTGDSIYHSLQAMFSSKFQNNSMLQVAYTFSKNLGDTTFGYVGTSTVFADNTNHRANRGPVDFDRRHVLSATLIYYLPALTNSHALLRQVAGGWESNTIVNYASGNAITVQGNNGLGDASGTGTTSGLFVNRPLRVTGQPCHLSSSPRGQWLNPNAFTWDGYQLGTFGNSGPGQCAGPPVDNVDFAIAKNWRLTERTKLQFRVEMFNVFNHPQFRFNGANLAFNESGCTHFIPGPGGTGQVCDSTVDTGTWPVDASGLLCKATPSSCVAIKGGALAPANFGQPQFSSQSGNREIQYALKFIF
jgi:carboxypeptidase family protein